MKTGEPIWVLRGRRHSAVVATIPPPDAKRLGGTLRANGLLSPSVHRVCLDRDEGHPSHAASIAAKGVFCTSKQLAGGLASQTLLPPPPARRVVKKLVLAEFPRVVSS
jgi:hypothetical protein